MGRYDFRPFGTGPVMTALADARRLIADSALFDAGWYTDTYADVTLTGADPAGHFLRYGRLLGRSPGPDFDTQFCLRTYADMAASEENPLVIFLRSPDRKRRPVTAAQFYQMIRAQRRAPVASARVLSFCLPAPALTPALRDTLEAGFAAGKGAAVEFLLADGSPGSDVRDWAQAAFPDQIASGLLRVFAAPPGATAHPRMARDVFGPHLSGEVSVLMQSGDALSRDQVCRLIGLARAHPDGFLFHQPARDPHGSDHRICLPSWIHAHLDPDPRFLPGSDSGAAMVFQILRHYPALSFVTPDPAQSVLATTDVLREAVARMPLANRQIALPDWPETRVAQRSASDADIARINAAVAVMAQTPDPGQRQEVLHGLNRHKMRLIEGVPRDRILPLLFAGHDRPLPPPVPDGALCLFACTRNEAPFLIHLIPHYRKLGVSRFFIVDDGSDVPIERLDLGPDVAVFRPTAGEFRTSKTLWIETLMKLLVPDGAWVLTVDADEFLHLPQGYPTLQDLVAALEASGREHAAGLLLDMLPAPGSDPASGDFRHVFTRFLSDPAPPPDAYLGDPAVQWGFGPWASLSWRFDVRYRLFGTVDSLRKMPLFRYRPDRHPNQGFHTFDYLDPQRMPGPEIWAQAPVLPILHYKLAKLFDDQARGAMLAQAGAYHAQTQDNIARSFGAAGPDLADRLSGLAGLLRPAQDADHVTQVFAAHPLAPRRRGTGCCGAATDPMVPEPLWQQTQRRMTDTTHLPMLGRIVLGGLNRIVRDTEGQVVTCGLGAAPLADLIASLSGHRPAVLDLTPLQALGVAAVDPAGFGLAARLVDHLPDGTTLADLCRAGRGEDRSDPHAAALDRLHHPCTAANLRALIAANDPASRHLRNALHHLRQQVSETLAQGPGIVLIGTGPSRWLTPVVAGLVPDRAMTAWCLNASHDPDMPGILCRAPAYRPRLPETVLTLHPTLFDHILTPVHPLFAGLLDQFGNTSHLSPPEIEAACVQALAELVPVLTTPTRADALALGNGNDGWIQGRIARDHPPDRARQLQMQILGLEDRAEFFTGHETPRPQPAAAGKPAGWAGSVAVVTRTKNRPLLFARAAQSIASQTWDNVHWVIVNDGGNPAPLSRIIDDSGIDPARITRLDNTVSRGMEAASNMGVRAVDTEFVVIHDDDDRWEPDFLQDSIEFLQTPRAAAADFEGVLSRAMRVSERIEGDEIITLATEPYMPWVSEVPLAQMAVGNFFAPISFLYRRRIFDRIGGYDERLPVLGDWRFNLDFLMQANIGFLDRYLSHYHHRDQDGGNYANSVTGAQRLHGQYFSVVTNAILRDPATPEGLRLVIANAHQQRVTEHNFTAMRAALHQKGTTVDPRPPSAATPAAPTPDPPPGPPPSGLLPEDRRHIARSIRNALPLTASPKRIAARLRWIWRLSRFDNPSVRRAHLPKLFALIDTPADFDHIAYLRDHPRIWATRFNGPDQWLPYHHYLLEGIDQGAVRPGLPARADTVSDHPA